jgi:hypothetical protein
VPHFNYMAIAMLAALHNLQVPCVLHYHPIQGPIHGCGFFSALLEDGVSQIEGILAEELRSFPFHSNISQFLNNLIHLSPNVRGDEGLIGLDEIHNFS